MKIKIKRFDKSLPLPKYQTDGAAAFDLYSRIDLEIKPGQVGYAKLNIALEIPKNYFVLLAARSSLHKLGLTMANGIGVGDSDYCGDNDEYHALLLNFSKQLVKIKKGQRICQALILPCPKIELIEVKNLKNKNRGGFGSTG